MRTLLLVSGSVRTFRENIRVLRDYDIAVYVSQDDDDTYFNHDNVRFLLEETCIKTLVIEQSQQIPTEYKDTRYQNTYKQWYKLQRLWQCVPKTYDVYVRLRPDVYIINADDFTNAIRNCDGLYIPTGNDRDGLNDQFAIGTQDTMNVYCNTIATLGSYPHHTSEYILARHLESLSVRRIPLPYKLVLSTAKVIAIAGDSGSGKSHICSLIRPLFLFDKVLEFETDRYHKWERGDEHWKHVTHLHPDANYLEKLEDDTFHLKIGDAILAVDYDHTTGRFTPPESIEPKENILVCGLHTLYSKQLRTLSDLKIYVDTSDELKTEWKLRRDTEERGHSKEAVLTRIESRRTDYETHIQPQREHADLVIRFYGTSLTLESRHREWFAGLPGEHAPNKITFHDPSIDVRKQIYEFLWGMDLPHIDALAGYEGVLQFTILRALYSKHG
jgi:uridine kinase